MKELNTEYGRIKGIVEEEYYSNGAVKGCIVSVPNSIQTDYGELIPQYENDGVRRKYINSIMFYPSGKLKNIALQKQTKMKTKIGELSAEFISFYESGQIKRLFPLNGKISGYWSEEEEYTLAQPYTLDLPSIGSLETKVIGILFYPSGSIKSLTFWPKDLLIPATPVGEIPVRTGISFYPLGEMRSCEPAMPIPIQTPIGKIQCYNVNAIGIHGDDNSLKFSEEGKVIALTTSTDGIEVIRSEGEKTVIKPELFPSVLDEEELEILPITIEFTDHKICLNEDTDMQFDLDTHEFHILTNVQRLSNSSCSGCSGCGSGCESCPGRM